MKTFGQEIWDKKMREQGDLGVIAGVRAKKEQVDRDAVQILGFFDREVHQYLKGNKALDVGVGPMSRFLIGLSKRSLIVDGVDISPLVLNEAKKKAELSGVTSSKFLNIDITKEIPKGGYDFIFCFGTFGHFPGYTALDVMRNFNKALNKGGVCMIHFWKPRRLGLREIISTSIYDFMRFVKLQFFKKTYLVSCSFYSKDDIEELCNRSEFNLIKLADRPNYFIAVLSKK